MYGGNKGGEYCAECPILGFSGHSSLLTCERSGAVETPNSYHSTAGSPFTKADEQVAIMIWAGALSCSL